MRIAGPGSAELRVGRPPPPRGPVGAAWAVALACLLIVGWTGCAKPQVATPAQVDALVAKNDTVGLAKLAARECGPRASNERQTCYEDFFVRLARSDRVHVALGALAALAANHSEIRRDGHGYTHIIGIRAWHPGGDVSTIFRSCTGLFQSGCYHGVIQAYLTENGTLDSARAVNLCNQIGSLQTDAWLRFQCVHGLGHGFEMAWNWNLPRALKGCDWLHSSWDRYSCYGGVFMENAVASQPGGHNTSVHALAASEDSAGGGKGGGEGEGGMSGMPGMEGMHHAPDPRTITFKMRDSTDPLYPCSVVDTMYEFSCYQLQGGIILNLVHTDFAAATRECDKAPPLGRAECYVSLGTNASGIWVQNNAKAIDACSNGDPAYQPYCFAGVVKNYIDVSGRPDEGIAFCKAVPRGNNRNFCFRSAGEEIAILYSADRDARVKACATAGDGDADCRMGAGVPAT